MWGCAKFAPCDAAGNRKTQDSTPTLGYIRIYRKLLKNYKISHKIVVFIAKIDVNASQNVSRNVLSAGAINLHRVSARGVSFRPISVIFDKWGCAK